MGRPISLEKATRAMLARPPRPRSESTKRLPKRDRAEAAAEAASLVGYEPRPTTRSQCLAGGRNEARPCPYVSCSAHLALEVHPRFGSIKTNFADLETMRDTCALDVADRGETTLEEVGSLMNLTRERVRVIEAEALAALASKGPVEEYAAKAVRRLPIAAIEIRPRVIASASLGGQFSVSCTARQTDQRAPKGRAA